MADRAWMGVTLVSNEEAEKAEFVVCARARDDQGTLTDNLLGTCHDCAEPVVFRPHAPKRPPRLCLACAVARTEGGHA